MSARLHQLALPKRYLKSERHPRYAITKHGVSIHAINFDSMKISNRLKFLAKPKKNYRQKFQKRRLTKYGITVRALKYKISERIKNLAKSKTCKIMNKNKHTRKDVTVWTLNDAYKPTDRVKKLAIPKKCITFSQNVFILKKSALKYLATPRIIELAEPRKQQKEKPVKKSKASGIQLSALKGDPPGDRYLIISKPKAIPPEQPKPQLTAFGVVTDALGAKASARTIALATPKQMRKKKKDEPPDVNPDLTKNGVYLKALSAKASDRVKILAQAKVYLEPEKRDITQYGLAKNALSYVASKRVISLSQPKPISK